MAALIPIINKFAWSLLLAMGFQFVFIGRKIKPLSSYQYFGWTMVLGAVMCTFYTIVLTDGYYPVTLVNVNWDRFSTGIGIICGYAMVRFHRAYAPAKKHWMESLLLYYTITFSSLFYFEISKTNGLFFEIENGKAINTSLFNFSVTLYCLIVFPLVFHYLRQGFRSARPEKRLDFKLLMVGFGVMGVGAIFDSLGPSFEWISDGIVYTNWAMLVYAVAVGIVLCRDWARLQSQNALAVSNFKSAKKKISEIVGLRTLGLATAGVSHDLRNYSAVMRNNVFLMQRDWQKSQLQDKMAGIAETLNEFSKWIETRTTDVAKYLRMTLRDLILKVSDRFGNQVVFAVGSWPDGITVSGEPFSLERVFQNLFQNSVEAGASEVRIGFTVESGQLKVEITDDGKGEIPDRTEESIGTFDSSKRDKGGTGLGLSIVGEILAMHKGRVETFSHGKTPGKSGFTVRMFFPIGS